MILSPILPVQSAAFSVHELGVQDDNMTEEFQLQSGYRF